MDRTDEDRAASRPRFTITDEELEREQHRDPTFSRYPALVDPDFALTVAWEKVTEWDYAADAHGWCHERPILLTLISTLRAIREELAGRAIP